LDGTSIATNATRNISRQPDKAMLPLPLDVALVQCRKLVSMALRAEGANCELCDQTSRNLVTRLAFESTASRETSTTSALSMT